MAHPSDNGPDWNAVTAAFDGELRAWKAYATEARRWADDLHARIADGLAPTETQVRVGGTADPARLAEHTEWVAESAERIAQTLRERLTDGDIGAALLVVLSPGPGAKGFDYRAPGFFHEPRQPGDLRPTWKVSDPDRVALLREALLPDAPPPEATTPWWARGLTRLLWTPAYGREERLRVYADALCRDGNPWAQ